MPLRSLRASPFAPVLVCLLCLLGLASCTDDIPPFCPPYHVGAVEGYVRSAGQGVSVPVGARAQEGDRRGSLAGVTTSDSTGWYRLELPTGLYRMEIDPDVNAIIFGGEMRDTLRVAQAVHRYDLIRGRAEITIALPPECDGQLFMLELSSRRREYKSLRQVAAGGTVQFDFPFIRPGPHGMALAVGSWASECYLPGTLDPAAADSLAVSADTVSRYTADFRDRYASISGRVTGSWQAASVSAPYVCASPDSMQSASSAGCGSDGSFTLRFLVPQQVRLFARIESVQQWIGGGSYAAARVFDLQPGDRIAGVTLVESGIELRLEGPGDLIDHEASVVIRDEAGREFEQTTYGGNTVSVCNLRPGRYYAYLDHSCDQTWIPQWYDGAAAREDAAPIDLAEGELRQVVFRLTAGGNIAGDLLTAEELPPESTRVQLFDAAGQQRCLLWTDRGMFAFAGLADGAYRLAASTWSSPSLWWYPGTSDSAAAGRITIAGHAAVTGLHWSLPPAGQEAQP